MNPKADPRAGSQLGWPVVDAGEPLSAAVADVPSLRALIDRLARDEGDDLGCAVEQVVSLVGGEFGLCVMGRSDIDIRTCPGLCEAVATGQVATMAMPRELFASAATAQLSAHPGWLTVVPLMAGGQVMGCVLVRSARPPALTPLQVQTALLIGRIALAFNRRRPAGQPGLERLAVSPNVTPMWGLPAVGSEAAHTVVVVDDDPDVSAGVRAALEGEGYLVTVAARAAEALAILCGSPPSLVILDVSLPDGDGFGVARALAAQGRTAHIPILFLSAAADLATRVRSLHREEADFLQKPFAWKELLTRVEQAVLRGEQRRQLRQSARMDELTGVGNRRLLEERLTVEGARIGRYGTPLSIVVIDVDGLKTINDRHGHAAGSAVLRTVGEVLRGSVRETDLAARYGGDEFVVLLPHTELEQAAAFAERVLVRLRLQRRGGLLVSVSIGVAGYDERRDASVEQLFERADQTAYQAKRAGGDRFCVDPPG